MKPFGSAADAAVGTGVARRAVARVPRHRPRRGTTAWAAPLARIVSGMLAAPRSARDLDRRAIERCSTTTRAASAALLANHDHSNAKVELAVRVQTVNANAALGRPGELSRPGATARSGHRSGV